jgi:hypothetical protein
MLHVLRFTPAQLANTITLCEAVVYSQDIHAVISRSKEFGVLASLSFLIDDLKGVRMTPANVFLATSDELDLLSSAVAIAEWKNILWDELEDVRRLVKYAKS